MSATSPASALPQDDALKGILLANGITLIFAVVQGWSVLHLMWPFWMQSLIIGWYARQRILRLTRFCTKGVKINDRAVEPTPETQQKVAKLFAIHYGGFHLIYLVFLLAFSLAADPQGFIDVTNETTGEVSMVPIGRVEPLDFLFYGALAWGFWRAHRASHGEHVAADLGNTPSIGALMFLPYARVIPMHLAILLAVPLTVVMPLGGRSAVLFFILLKTGADVLMHVVEHRILQGRSVPMAVS